MNIIKEIAKDIYSSIQVRIIEDELNWLIKTEYNNRFN